MSGSQRRDRLGAGSGASTGAVLRGLLVVLVAVALALVLLNGTDEELGAAGGDPVRRAGGPAVAGGALTDEDPTDDDGVTTTALGRDGDAAEEDEAAADGSTTTSSTSSSTTSTTAAGPREPEDVTVLVANGSGLQGAAATVTEALGGAGYATAEPSNLAEGTRANASAVYYVEGYEDEAAALAETFTPAPPVAPMPVPPPLDDLRGASVLLVLGPDLATP
jgi:hypothetical protein